ncbi:hypothetical protein GHT06_003834 [Daphnia sinensis]|uniref:Uncharacterized protein n=1 Tax=Daphnia sinensis TaxID=1820382 RepID=A0AAD5L2D4_9CRUS|nr:hypothetical protein GHT06_003834 [Daphnia sinensis]
MDKLTSHDNTARIQRILPFAATLPDVHQAIKQAYDYAKAHRLDGNTAQLFDAINLHAVKILRGWHDAALAQQRAMQRLSEQTNTYTSRPMNTSLKGHNKVQASVVPRPAQNVPCSRLPPPIPNNRTFAPIQLRQMRGVATSELESFFS